MKKTSRIFTCVLAIVLMCSTLSYAESTGQENGFSDVSASAWYSDAVDWAVEEGIANGTGNGAFSPNAVCTRAQIVTFIWRMAGSPEPHGRFNAAFTDLDEGAYYYDAMMWANENGIISGTSATTLSPNANCTRAQAVTLLWRYAGDEEGYSTYFVDVPESAYYYEAVAWASNRYVADGTSLLGFSPDGVCTRAQIVTMLYRMQRTGTEALQSGDIKSVRIENNFKGGERSLSAGEITEFKAVLSRAALNENPEPQGGQGQNSDPMYTVYVGYADGGEDVFYSTEAGATVLYKLTGTYGPGGAGYIAVRSAEMQSLFDGWGV